jgi:hypothetical protein
MWSRPALGDGVTPNNLVAHCSIRKTSITVSTVLICDFLREITQKEDEGSFECNKVVRTKLLEWWVKITQHCFKPSLLIG